MFELYIAPQTDGIETEKEIRVIFQQNGATSHPISLIGLLAVGSSNLFTSVVCFIFPQSERVDRFGMWAIFQELFEYY